jgi:hypothetical protein
LSKRIISVGLFALTFLVGCDSGTDEHERTVQNAIRRTSSLSRSFVYTEAAGGGATVVQGIFEDDYRYKAQVSLGKQPIIEQVVVDDAVAMRFLDPVAAEASLVNTSEPPQAGARLPAGASQPVPTGGTLDVLRGGRWVLDPAGAPEVVSPSRGEGRQVGDNPLLDGVTVLSYVDKAIEEAGQVVRFNKEASTYRANEDTFPIPEDDTNVVRYDLIAPDLPRPLRQGGTASGGTLQASHFRRMAIYIKGGRVVEVREEIGALRRHLRHLIEFYDVNVSQDADIRRAGPAAIRELNQSRRGAGSEPIRQRSMSLELLDLGEAKSIQLPGDAAQGNLSIFFAQTRRGQQT